MKNTAILLVQCPDRTGLDATLAEFIYRYDGNILHFEQHQAGDERFYLARVEWDLEDFRLDLRDFDGAFGPVAHKFGMNWVLALSDRRPRYMQVLSTDFIVQYPQPIINIHHSFLPAFIGAKPHLQAYERGVKLIGATAHYVTEVLDDGPIIEQGITRISHRDSLDDLVEKGRDLEKAVLSRAVRWHIENRIFVHGNKTVIFD